MNIPGLHRDRVYELVALRAFGSVPPKWSAKTIEFHRKRKHIDANDRITDKALDILVEAERPYSILGYMVERKHRPSERRGYVGEAYEVTHWRAKSPTGGSLGGGHGVWGHREMRLVAMSNDGRTCYVQVGAQCAVDSIYHVETIDFVSLIAAGFGIVARPCVAVAA